MLLEPQVVDYTKQLEEIVRQLSRPSLPIWIGYALSAVLGSVGGLTTQFVLTSINRSRGKNEMRQVVYSDLAEIYWHFLFYTSVKFGLTRENLNPDEQGKLTRLGERRGGGKYRLGHFEVYVSLPERVFFDPIFSLSELAFESASRTQMGVVLAQIAAFTQEDHECGQDARRYWGEQQFERIRTGENLYSGFDAS